MPHSTTLSPGTIEASINYYNEPPPGEPYPVQYVNSAGSKRQKWNAQNVRITDLRTTDKKFDIHQNGFQFLKYTGTEGLKYEAFADEDNIKTKVYEEVKDLLRTAYATDCTWHNSSSALIKKAELAPLMSLSLITSFDEILIKSYLTFQQMYRTRQKWKRSILRC